MGEAPGSQEGSMVALRREGQFPMKENAVSDWVSASSISPGSR